VFTAKKKKKQVQNPSSFPKESLHLCRIVYRKEKSYFNFRFFFFFPMVVDELKLVARPTIRNSLAISASVRWLYLPLTNILSDPYFVSYPIGHK
jgi:hypothetical protein